MRISTQILWQLHFRMFRKVTKTTIIFSSHRYVCSCFSSSCNTPFLFCFSCSSSSCTVFYAASYPCWMCVWYFCQPMGFTAFHYSSRNICCKNYCSCCCIGEAPQLLHWRIRRNGHDVKQLRKWWYGHRCWSGFNQTYSAQEETSPFVVTCKTWERTWCPRRSTNGIVRWREASSRPSPRHSCARWYPYRDQKWRRITQRNNVAGCYQFWESTSYCSEWWCGCLQQHLCLVRWWCNIQLVTSLYLFLVAVLSLRSEVSQA